MVSFKYRVVLLLTVVMVMILHATSGCTVPIPDVVPPIEIEVYQRKEEVSFEFFHKDTILFLIKYRDRIGVTNLSIRGSNGELIWYVTFAKTDPTPVAQEVRYGIVPPGFYQLIPRTGDAPRLKNNAEYKVSVSWGVIGGSTTFVYRGAKVP